MEEFENWLRMVCFQKPTPEAYDLAKDAWKEAQKTRPTPDKDKLGFNPDYALKASQDALKECMKELNRLHGLVAGVEWVGECKDEHCINGKMEKCGHPNRTEDCLDCAECNGTGQIHRQATLDEAMEGLSKVLRDGDSIIRFSSYDIRSQLLSQALTVNKGRLRIKEKP